MTKAKNEVVSTQNQSTAVALPDDLLAELASAAKETAALERPAVGGISFRAGMLSYQGEPVKGNKLRCVIIGAAHINTYYTTKWDPDSPSNPACFSLSEDGVDMAPDEVVPEPLSATCHACPKFQWGSDVKDGKPAKGKACKESRRLVVLPESALGSVEDVQSAELAMLKLPVTSVKNWSNFINTLAATVNLPYFAVVTEITTQPDMKTQFKVLLSPVDKIPNADVMRAIMAKRTEAMRIAMLPFDPAEESTEPAPAAKEKF
jgi:hypothetical protein